MHNGTGAKASAAALSSDGSISTPSLFTCTNAFMAPCNTATGQIDLPAIRKQANTTPSRNDHTSCATTRASAWPTKRFNACGTLNKTAEIIIARHVLLGL